MAALSEHDAELQILANAINDSVASDGVRNDGTVAAATESAPAVGNIVKLANLTTSSNESDGEEPTAENAESSAIATESGRSCHSPPPNCAICLSRCKKKCFTDSCLHQFCFKCLCEWSKIKAECPLCKQPFKSIIHNVRSLDQYDRYHVQPIPQLADRPITRILWNDRPPVLVPLNRQLVVNEPVMRNIYPGASSVSQSRYEPYRNELMNLMNPNQEDHIRVGSLSQLWRRYVYNRKLYALPVSDAATGQFREWSARFYRNNPAQIHRLMPWINRDVVCLLNNNVTHNVSVVLQIINDILPLSNILGPTFRRRLMPYLGDHTSHFIHELFNFARSPYDMIGYDRVVQYSAQVGEEVTIGFSSSSSDEEANNTTESERIARLRYESLRQGHEASVIVTNPTVAGNGATHSLRLSLPTDGLVLPRASIRNNGVQSVAINLTMHSRDDDIIEIEDNEMDANEVAANAEVAAINNRNQIRRQAGAELPITDHIELLNSSNSEGHNSSDNSSECQFVLERKPPHLRTPELVSLNSESDSDVVFVESAPIPVPAEKPVVNTNTEAAASLYMGASTSTGLQSNPGKCWRKILDYTKKRNRRSLRSRNAKSRSQSQQSQTQLRHGKPHYASSFASNSSTSSSSSSSSDKGTSSTSTTSSSDSESESDNQKKRLRTRRRRIPLKSKRQKTKNNDAAGGDVAERPLCTNSRKRKSNKTSKTKEKKRRISGDFANTDSSSSTSSESSEDKLSLNMLKANIAAQKLKQECEPVDEYAAADAAEAPTTSTAQWFKTEFTNNFPFETVEEAATIDDMAFRYSNSSRSTSISTSSSSSSSSTTTNMSSFIEDANAVPEKQNCNNDLNLDGDDDDDETNENINVVGLDADNNNDDDENINAPRVASSLSATESTIALHNDIANSLMDFAASAAQRYAFDHEEVSINNETNNTADDLEPELGDVTPTTPPTPATPLRNYVNSLIEDARLPIYSDVSSDAAPQMQPNNNQSIVTGQFEESEGADIDVGY